MKIPEAKNILIIKWGALGDLIMSTSTVKTVRDNYPDAKITMLANSIMKELLPEGFIVDDYILLKKTGRRVDESVLKQLLLIREIRKRKFDLVINLKWKSERASLLTFMSGAEIRVGYKEKSFYNVFTHCLDHPVGGYHEVYRNMDILKPIGLKPGEGNPVIYISGEDQKLADNFFKVKNLTRENTICVHPGASKANRAWQPERFTELSKKIISEFGVKIIITYGKNELDLAKKITNGIGPGAVLSSETKSISQLAAVIKNCSLYISVCTGPMNVANAVKTPVIALLGSTDPADWAPFGEIHRIIKSPYVLKEYTDEDERKALDEISVESVWRVTEKRWNEIRK